MQLSAVMWVSSGDIWWERRTWVMYYKAENNNQQKTNNINSVLLFISFARRHFLWDLLLEFVRCSLAVCSPGDIEPGEMVPAALHTHCLLAECSAEPQKGPYLWFHATVILTLPLHYFEVTFWAWSHLLEDVGLYCLYHRVLWVVVLGLKHSDAVLPWLLPGLPVGFPAGCVVLWVALRHSLTGWSWGNESLDCVRADFVHYAAWMDGGYAIKQRDLTNLMKRAFRIYLRDWIYHKALILPSVQMQLEAVFNGMSLLSWGAPYLGRL